MAFKKTFVLSDEGVNSYGFVVQTDGIGLGNAMSNMPCFYDHRTWEIPLGHWENLRKEDGKLLGDLVINGDNEREKTYINKIQNGDIKGASIGAEPINWCSDTQLLKPGQTKPTLTDCTLFEASITPLPANSAALALKHEGNLVTLSKDNSGHIIPFLTKHSDMKAIALKLGLPEAAGENEILAAISSIQENPKPSPLPLKGSSEAKLVKDVRVSQLIKMGRVGSSPAGNANTDSFDYLQKHNRAALARIQRDEPATFRELVEGYGAGVRYKA
ncbi:HK97 family phage prohead protease [Parasediminibacterium sp. JCM 36343]|uniref:HK97 family phage prohead protease n=1 Tax=Parasediminibacterium sp. JCM 36343 TaxID=3374279 RepID=UPI00397AD040